MAERNSEEGSRRRFLASAGAAMVLLAACGDDDDGGEEPTRPSKRAGGDIDIVNYALTLEYLEAAFYEQVIESGELKDRRVAEVAKGIAQDEQEHVDALTQTVEQLGGKPAAAPKTRFESVLAGGQDKILETAATVENLGASAYLGQATRIESPEVLAAALSIHSNEGRHAAALNAVVGKSIVPDGAFAKPADMKTVLAAVRPFIAA